MHFPIAASNAMAKRPISDLAQDILRFQKQKVIDSVVNKFADQNVHRAADLLFISKDALEFKLYNDGSLSLDETSHTISLREPYNKSPGVGRKSRWNECKKQGHANWQIKRGYSSTVEKG